MSDFLEDNETIQVDLFSEVEEDYYELKLEKDFEYFSSLPANTVIEDADGEYWYENDDNEVFYLEADGEEFIKRTDYTLKQVVKNHGPLQAVSSLEEFLAEM